MMYNANVAVCSEIHTKHSTQSEHHVQFLNIKPGCTKRNRQGLKGWQRRARGFKPNPHTAILNIMQIMELLTNCVFAGLWTVSVSIKRSYRNARTGLNDSCDLQFLQILPSMSASYSEVSSTDTRVNRTARRIEVNLETDGREEIVTVREECGRVIPRAFLPWLQHSKRFNLLAQEFYI